MSEQTNQGEIWRNNDSLFSCLFSVLDSHSVMLFWYVCQTCMFQVHTVRTYECQLWDAKICRIKTPPAQVVSTRNQRKYVAPNVSRARGN